MADGGTLRITLELDGHAVEVEYDYEPGEDAQTSGPPENCYEGTDESISLIAVHIGGKGGIAVDAELFSDEVKDRWTDEIHEHQERERERDLAAAAEDAIADAMEWR